MHLAGSAQNTIHSKPSKSHDVGDGTVLMPIFFTEDSRPTFLPHQKDGRKWAGDKTMGQVCWVWPACLLGDCHCCTLHRMVEFNFSTWNVRGISVDPSEYMVCGALNQYGINLAVLTEMKDSKGCYKSFQQGSAKLDIGSWVHQNTWEIVMGSRLLSRRHCGMSGKVFDSQQTIR